MAVFTLPQEMLPLYKVHIEFLTEHAVDPDKRRYAYKAEGPKHFIDLDSWGTFPFSNIPRNWRDVKIAYSKVKLFKLDGSEENFPSILALKDSYMALFDSIYQSIPFNYFEEEWEVTNLNNIALDRVVCMDTFYAKGVLPYQLLILQGKLQKALEQRDIKKVLHYSADIGHYIGDAHVPLHTTKNYDGQLTNQEGIHAFWESRIPELFAEKQYDQLVGQAVYIKDPSTYYWDIVLASHALVDSVLAVEQRLRNTFPANRQFCFDNRLEKTDRIQCEEFAAAYQDAMKGMVEERWRASIQAVGSVWYTAWVDAGQPDLEAWKDNNFGQPDEEEVVLENKYKAGKIFGRKH